MGRLHRIIYGKKPSTAVIKKKAHAFTVLCVVWSFFSLFALPLFRDGIAKNEKEDVGVAIGMWVLHLVFIGVTVWLWITEKPREVPILETSTDIGIE